MARTAAGESKICTGAQLAETIQRLMANADGEAVCVLVRDFLRRASGWARRKQPPARLLVEAVERLGSKPGPLEALLRWLDQADNAFYHRTTRDFPNLFLRRPNTVARLRLFIAEHGSPTARKRLDAAFRAVDAPAGKDLAASVIDALERGADHAVAEAVERLLARFEGTVHGDAWAGLRKELDDFARTLAKAGRVQQLVDAVGRRDHELDRRIGGVEIYGLARQLEDLIDRCSSDAARRAWRKALGHERTDGKQVAKRVIQRLERGEPTRAVELLVDEIVAPLDERFASSEPDTVRALEDALRELHRRGKLLALLQAVRSYDEQRAAEQPNAIHVGVLHRLQSAIDRRGSEKIRALWREQTAVL